jgi:hypothetical protein
MGWTGPEFLLKAEAHDLEECSSPCSNQGVSHWPSVTSFDHRSAATTAIDRPD